MTLARTLVLVAAFFVVGFVVGGLGPRGEVRRLEEENFELTRKGSRGGGTGELSRLLTGRFTEPASTSEPVDGGTLEPGEGLPEEAREGAALAEDLGGASAEPRTPEEARELARELMATRAAAARAAFAEDAQPTPEQQAEIDRAVAAMNEELTQVARDVAARIRDGEEPGRRELMSLGAEMLDVLVATEDRMLGALTPEQRALVRDEASDPTAFIDPSIVDLLEDFRGVDP